MAWSQTHLDKLEKAIASGAREVRFQGHTTVFHSLDEMLRLRDIMKREVNSDAIDSGVSYTEYESGL